MEYHSVIKKNQLLRNITTWMDLKNILSENQSILKILIVGYITKMSRKENLYSRKQIRGCLGQGVETGIDSKWV